MYLNNGSGWKQDSLTWNSPIDFVRFDGLDYIDEGVQLVDFNGDGRVDIFRASDDSNHRKKAYMTKRFKYKISLIYLINKIGEENGKNN